MGSFAGARAQERSQGTAVWPRFRHLEPSTRQPLEPERPYSTLKLVGMSWGNSHASPRCVCDSMPRYPSARERTSEKLLRCRAKPAPALRKALFCPRWSPLQHGTRDRRQHDLETPLTEADRVTPLSRPLGITLHLLLFFLKPYGQAWYPSRAWLVAVDPPKKRPCDRRGCRTRRQKRSF